MYGREETNEPAEEVSHPTDDARPEINWIQMSGEIQ